MSERIELELLIKAPSPPRTVTVDNVEAAVPRKEDVERCRRWLASQGLECHATDFGIVCRGFPETMEAVFGDVSEPIAPREIAELVTQVTTPRRPELF